MRHRKRRRGTTSALARLMLLVPFMAGWCGCSLIYTEVALPVYDEDLELIDGQTTYREVIHAFGPPIDMSALDVGGMVMVYDASDIEEIQLGLSLNIDFWEWFKFVYGTADVDRHVLIAVFDANGQLRAQGYTAWTDDLGTGMSLQFILSVIPVLDSSHLHDPISQNEWGWTLLKSIPENLNQHSNMSNGQRGIQQVGTPFFVGQETLEMKGKAR